METLVKYISIFGYYTIFDGKDTGNLVHNIIMRCMNLTRDKPGIEKKESIARRKES